MSSSQIVDKKSVANEIKFQYYLLNLGIKKAAKESIKVWLLEKDSYSMHWFYTPQSFLVRFFFLFLNEIYPPRSIKKHYQLTFTYSKSTIEILEKGVKYLQS